MAICPDGHESAATDYCDICGSAMVEPSATVYVCAKCGAPRDERFCEKCGHDSLDTGWKAGNGGGPVDPIESDLPIWIATISADRGHYERMIAQRGPDANQVEFPDYYPERRIILNGSDFLIGKRSVSQGVHPDIDLGIAPADIGVSRAHALLHIGVDGLTLTDLGSTNGTYVNSGTDPIRSKSPLPLRSGDRIHVGGWTTIELIEEQE